MSPTPPQPPKDYVGALSAWAEGTDGAVYLEWQKLCARRLLARLAAVETALREIIKFAEKVTAPGALHYDSAYDVDKCADIARAALGTEAARPEETP